METRTVQAAIRVNSHARIRHVDFLEIEKKLAALVDACNLAGLPLTMSALIVTDDRDDIDLDGDAA